MTYRILCPHASLLVALILYALPSIGVAACASPTANAGSMNWNGSAMQVCDGTNWSNLGGGGSSYSVDVQTFNSTGTWTKPGSGTVAQIECWGGGGSGAKHTTYSQGGGGGGYNATWKALASLGATETVTIGSGGAAQTTASTKGNNGGNSSFGAHLTAYGGTGGGMFWGGDFSQGGCGGGQLSAATNPSGVGDCTPAKPEIVVTLMADVSGGTAKWCSAGMSAGKNCNGATPSTYAHGAGGGAMAASTATNGNNNGGSSVYGAAGGGSYGYTENGGSYPFYFGTGGTSSFGGNGGGAASGTATAGAQPGGGGGATTSGTSGAGGTGRCNVRVY